MNPVEAGAPGSDLGEATVHLPVGIHHARSKVGRLDAAVGQRPQRSVGESVVVVCDLAPHSGTGRARLEGLDAPSAPRPAVPPDPAPRSLDRGSERSHEAAC